MRPRCRSDPAAPNGPTTTRLCHADEIRDQLAAMGITVVDQPDGGVRWHRQ
ncbi:hypothetical protein PN498_02100 [Oscillatoria sp. CS-180]|uniref:hypothetical protein n=1 Tax=Oscillatoria sp. CS-180 TaxID=3021720 RepID=UPI00232C376B|nr:hypothetical protein [Oscillatoria sp. CS-180]MDB9524766.1 hypothetical protein [Oscillatoria sp. CS-180]